MEPPQQLAASWPIAPFGFVDDQEFMVEQVAGWQAKEGLPTFATTSWEEALDWVSHDQVRFLLSDLRFPDGSGLELLRRAKRANPSFRGAIVTEYDVEPWERQQARDLGVPIYRKRDQLEDFLSRFRPSASDATSSASAKIVELELRIQTLEALNTEWSQRLVAHLLRVKDPSAVITHGDESFTVSELVDDIKSLRPRGIDHIRMFQKLIDHLLDREVKK